MEVIVFKKFTAFVLLITFTQVYAGTPVEQSFHMTNELKKTFDELSYKVNVEWDQSDSAFMNNALEDFDKEITKLQEQGLSSEELVQFTLSNLKDEKTRNEIIKFQKASDLMSSDEARDFALSRLNSTYSNGASWVGVYRVSLIITLIALITSCLIAVKELKKIQEKQDTTIKQFNDIKGKQDTYINQQDAYINQLNILLGHH